MCTLSGYTIDDIIDLLAQAVDRPAFTEVGPRSDADSCIVGVVVG